MNKVSFHFFQVLLTFFFLPFIYLFILLLSLHHCIYLLFLSLFHFFIFKIILLLFKYSCLHFTPTTPHPTPAKLISLPCFHPRPWFCSCVLYSCSWKLFPSLSPPNSPLVIVKLFLISMSLVIYCLIFSFVDYVPVKGEITWYFSLTSWLISLSITLSSSIHAVAKGRSSFFLSAAYNSIV